MAFRAFPAAVGVLAEAVDVQRTIGAGTQSDFESRITAAIQTFQADASQWCGHGFHLPSNFSDRAAQATLNRRTVLVLVNCAARSGSAFFSAAVSMRLLVMGFQVIRYSPA